VGLIGKWRVTGIPVVMALACLISSSCTPAPADPAKAGSRPPAKTGSAGASQPLPAGTVGDLPPSGVLYLLAGTSLPDYNLWQVSANRLRQVTFNPDLGFSAFGASKAGVILADDKFENDLLAILTSAGPKFLHQGTASRSFVDGSEPAISGTGMISYVTPPSGGSSLFRIWIRKTPASRSVVVYRSADALSGPVVGPGGRLAITWTQGQDGTAGKSELAIIPATGGRPAVKKSCLNSVVQLVWSTNAAALAVASLNKNLCLIYPNGTVKRLPSGWYPLAWSPNGHQLLVQDGRLLRLWSASNPSAARVIGPITPGFDIREASWLPRAAPRT
jgi:hypothetical protein